MLQNNGGAGSGLYKPSYSTPLPASKFRESPRSTPDDLVASSPVLNDQIYPVSTSRREPNRTSLSPSFRLSRDVAAPNWKEDTIAEYEPVDSLSANGSGNQRVFMKAHEENGGGVTDSPAYRHRTNNSIELNKYSELSLEEADEIMDNARRKLSALEGNLKGARHSLLSPSTSSARNSESSKLSSGIRVQTSLGTEDEERLRTRGPRIKFGQPRQSPSATTASTQRSPIGEVQSHGHNRVYSETSVPTGLGTPIKGSRILEPNHVTLDPLRRSPLSNEGQESKSPRSAAGSSVYGSSGSSNRRVSSLAQYQASPSTRELRGKAEELKGRLSFIQERVREDAVKRTSFQPTKSAFETDENALITEVSVLEQTIEEQEELLGQLERVQRDLPGYQPPKTEDASGEDGPADDYSTDGSLTDSRSGSQQLKGVLKTFEAKKTIPQRQSDARAEWQRVLSENHYDLETGSISPTEEEGSEYEFQSVLEHQLAGVEEEDEEVLVEGAHEDRADAFDYEHFILHSALGSYVSSKLSTSSSETSVSTTRGPEQQDFLDAQQINSSVTSFATATEAQGSDSGSEGAEWDEIDNSWPVPPASNRQSTAVYDVNDATPTTYVPHGQNVGVFTSARGSQDSRRPASIIMSALLTSGGVDQMVEEADKALVRSIAEELSHICMRLCNVASDAKEATVLRSKLQQVNRLLDDEDTMDEQTVNELEDGGHRESSDELQPNNVSKDERASQPTNDEELEKYLIAGSTA